MSGYDFVAMWIDGKTFSKNDLIVAVGLTIEGRKIILGFTETATENKQVSANFLNNLLGRGMSIEEGILVMWYVYIIECKDGSLYTGITGNLKRRFEEHKSGKGGKFTRAFKFRKLLFSELCGNKNDALKREVQIKGWTRKKKLALIKGDLELLNKL